MLPHGEHARVLAEHRRQVGRTIMSHKDELSAERSRWQAEQLHLRQARRAHRAVLGAERDRLAALRKEHKEALRQNRWLMALVDMVSRDRG